MLICLSRSSDDIRELAERKMKYIDFNVKKNVNVGGVTNMVDKKVRKNIKYLDANNFYGWQMIQKLSTHGFAWEKVHNFTSEK